MRLYDNILVRTVLTDKIAVQFVLGRIKSMIFRNKI